MLSSRALVASLVVALLAAACATGSDPAPVASDTPVAAPSPTATEEPTPPDDASPSDAPSIRQPRSEYDRLLDRGDYVVSDEWVVETVVADLDMATGGLAVLDDGTFLQADFGRTGSPGDALYRVSPDGDVEVLAQSDEFAALTMTHVGPDGAIYQSGYTSDAVFRIEPDGTHTTLAADIFGAAGVIADEDGTVFAGSYDTGAVRRIDPDGTVSDLVRDGALSSINSLTHGPDGRIFTANHRNGRIHEVTRDGELTLVHEFPKATSHVVFHDGSLFVTSRGVHLVFRIDLESGVVELIAGDGEPGDADGRGRAASFARPNAIAVGPDGHLYFNHGQGRANHPVTIRRLVHDP